MKILIAGGAGYIGSALVPDLLERGYAIDVADTLMFGNYLPDTVRVIRKDIFDLNVNDLADYDQVIFLAGVSNDPMAEFDPAVNFIYNAASPSYLAFIAKMAGVRRFIYASSCSVYGYTVDELYDEESPVTCGYPYGISKLQGERGVMQLQDEGFSVISLRQGTVCGYSPRMRMDLIVNTMWKFALSAGQITVNNPSIWRPLYDIRDASNAYLRAIQAHPSISGVFNVASGNYTVGQIGDIVKSEVQKTTGRKINLEIKDIQDFRNYKVSIDKARTVLGFVPEHNVHDTVAHLFENQDAIGDFDKDEYYNIRVFKTIKMR